LTNEPCLIIIHDSPLKVNTYFEKNRKKFFLDKIEHMFDNIGNAERV